MLDFTLNVISASQDGDGCFVEFEEKRGASESEGDDKYFLMSMWDEGVDDEPLCYIETRQGFGGHFRFLDAELASDHLQLRLLDPETDIVEHACIRFNAKPTTFRRLRRVLSEMIPHLRVSEAPAQ